jgi:hypothetical protein
MGAERGAERGDEMGNEIGLEIDAGTVDGKRAGLGQLGDHCSLLIMGQICELFKPPKNPHKFRTNVRLGIDIARLFGYTWEKLGNKRS